MAKAASDPGAKHICIVSGGHLWRNPRVVKEADALSAAGYRVTVVGYVLTAADQALDDTILSTRTWPRIAAPNLAKPGAETQSFLTRLGLRASQMGVRWLGLPLAGSLAYGLADTIRAAAAVKADLYVCHAEIGLAAFSRLSRLGYRCAADFEDWYSQDLTASARRDRPMRLIERLEREAMTGAALTITTSDCLAGALVAVYGGTRPVVVYNAFDPHSAGSEAPRDRVSTSRPSLHWYSQAIGEGRGLELLFDAIDRLDQDFELHIRGRGSQAYQDALLGRLRAATRPKVHFHPTVTPHELPDRIAEHDIGLALEAARPPSRDLTITNKVFQYLQCGCAVVATRTSGQEEAASRFPGALTLAEQNPAALAEAIGALIGDPSRLAAARKASREAGAGPASWSEASKVLVQAVARALSPQDAGR